MSSWRMGLLPAIATGAKVSMFFVSHPPPLMGTRTGRITPRLYPEFGAASRSPTPSLYGVSNRPVSSMGMVRMPASSICVISAGKDSVAIYTGYRQSRSSCSSTVVFLGLGTIEFRMSCGVMYVSKLRPGMGMSCWQTMQSLQLLNLPDFIQRHVATDIAGAAAVAAGIDHDKEQARLVFSGD